MIHYVTGDATLPIGPGPKIVAHVCNDSGYWGAGFVLAVSERWPQPEAEYARWYRGCMRNDFGLGAVKYTKVEPDVWVANMIAQHGIRMDWGAVPLRYDALAECLGNVGRRSVRAGASVHMPRIGCGLAGGRWEEVEPLIEQHLCRVGVRVTVYDLPEAGTGG